MIIWYTKYLDGVFLAMLLKTKYFDKVRDIDNCIY